MRPNNKFLKPTKNKMHPVLIINFAVTVLLICILFSESDETEIMEDDEGNENE